MAKKVQLIGRQDKIDLPDFGLTEIDAKIDTGAYTSSINCSRVKVKTVNGVKELSFYLSGNRIHETRSRKFTTTDFRKKKIRSSNGQTEERFVIKTRMVVFGKKIKVEFSLADRSKMKFPVLIGRKLLTDRFIVDVSKKNLSYLAESKNEDRSSIT